MLDCRGSGYMFSFSFWRIVCVLPFIIGDLESSSLFSKNILLPEANELLFD